MDESQELTRAAITAPVKKKYLCIDTCIFIACCLLESEGDAQIKEALEVLLIKLADNEVILLLPEVIKLEFTKILRTRLADMSQSVAGYKTTSEAKPRYKLMPAMITRLQKKVDEFVAETIQNTETTNEIIQRIFTHPNVITIPISADLISEAYKISLIGEKPSKEGVTSLQADCIIVASLASCLETETDYDLFICTINTTDFGDTADINNPKIHPDIKKHFTNAVLYTNLLTLLNDELGTAYPAELIEKLAEESYSKRTEIHLQDNLSVNANVSNANSSVGGISGPESATEI